MKFYSRYPSTLINFSILLMMGGCATQEKPDEPTGKVTVVVVMDAKDSKTGTIITTVESREEIAARAVSDSGSETLLTAQKVAAIDSSFSSYNLGPNNEIVASVDNKEGKQGSDIWVIGTGKSRITKSEYFNNTPSYSNDGKYIYFTSSRGRTGEQNSYIWRMPASGGGGITRIGTPVFSYAKPLESPDGTKILYSAREYFENSPYIWYSTINGGLPTQLTPGTDATWLNNDKILFTMVDENTKLHTIWTVNTDGSQLTQLITDKELDCIQPAASQDGKYIAYVKQKPNEATTRDIYVFNAESGLSQQLTTNISRDDFPSWSKESKQIFFRSTRGIGWNIWSIPASKL